MIAKKPKLLEEGPDIGYDLALLSFARLGVVKALDAFLGNAEMARENLNPTNGGLFQDKA